MTDLTIPAGVPGMAEAADSVLGFEPWAVCDDCAASDWWVHGANPVVPLSLPAGRLVALDWLRDRTPLVWWLPQLRWALDATPRMSPIARVRYRAWREMVLDHAKAEGWTP